MKRKMLLKTELKEPGLDGGRQVTDIEVTHDRSLSKGTKVQFCGVGTVRDYGQSIS